MQELEHLPNEAQEAADSGVQVKATDEGMNCVKVPSEATGIMSHQARSTKWQEKGLGKGLMPICACASRRATRSPHVLGIVTSRPVVTLEQFQRRAEQEPARGWRSVGRRRPWGRRSPILIQKENKKVNCWLCVDAGWTDRFNSHWKGK